MESAARLYQAPACYFPSVPPAPRGRQPLRLIVLSHSAGWCPRKAATVDRLCRLFEVDPPAAVFEASRIRAAWPGFEVA